MNRRIALAALAVALAGGSARAAAQPQADTVQPPVHPGFAPPFIALMGQRESLSLTSAQVTAIDSLSEALRDANRELTLRYREVRDSVAGRGELNARERRRVMLAARPVFAALRDNHRAASLGIRDLLSDDQRRQVCEMFGPGPAEEATPRARNRRPGDPQTDVTEPWGEQPGGDDLWDDAPERRRRPDGTPEPPRWPVRAMADMPHPEPALFWCTPAAPVASRPPD